LNGSVKIIFCIQCCLSLLAAGLGAYFEYSVHNPHDSEACKTEIKTGDLSLECQYAFYLDLPKKIGSPAGKTMQIMGSWILIFTNFVPISLMVSLEIVKLW